MHRKRHYAIIVLLLLVAIIVGACNGDEDEGRGDKRPTVPAFPTTTTTPATDESLLPGTSTALPTLPPVGFSLLPARAYKLARVPHGLRPMQAQAIVESVDRGTDIGRGDYAILTMLHTYGVRGCQIRALRFLQRIDTGLVVSGTVDLD